MPDDEIDLPIGDDELERLEEIVDDVLKEDEKATVKARGKLLVGLAFIVIGAVWVTKQMGLW